MANFGSCFPQQEKVLCVWLNSTLGLMAYWIESNRNQDGRGGITVTAIPDLPLLDVTMLADTQIDAAAKILMTCTRKNCSRPTRPGETQFVKSWTAACSPKYSS